MKAAELNKIYTVPEYFLLEESSEIRHEFIDGSLIEMSGASREHHKICKKSFKIIGKFTKAKGLPSLYGKYEGKN